MQIALQDIRRWGNKKISLKYFQTSESKFRFINRIASYNNQNYSIKASPYSVPSIWTKVDFSRNLRGIYDSFLDFTYSCEPLLDNVVADDIVKRKFRNTWTKLWSNLAKDLDLSSSEEKVLMEFGLRLAFIVNSGVNLNEDLNEILEFYNIIIKWSLFTQKECNFDRNGMNHLDIIDMLIFRDSSDLVNDILLDFI